MNITLEHRNIERSEIIVIRKDDKSEIKQRNDKSKKQIIFRSKYTKINEA